MARKYKKIIKSSILQNSNIDNLTPVEWLAKTLYEQMEIKGDGKRFDTILEIAKSYELTQIVLAFKQGEIKDKVNSGLEYYCKIMKKFEI